MEQTHYKTQYLAPIRYCHSTNCHSNSLVGGAVVFRRPFIRLFRTNKVQSRRKN